MRIIDADALLKNKTDHEMISTHLIYNAPTVEAIPKADYEVRLKADMVAMLTEIQLEIEEMDSGCGWEGYRPTAQVLEVIQQKINTLKEQNNE